MDQTTSLFEALDYTFTPREILALYRLIYCHIGFLPRDDEEITSVINHITQIMASNGMATGHHQAT